MPLLSFLPDTFVVNFVFEGTTKSEERLLNLTSEEM